MSYRTSSSHRQRKRRRTYKAQQRLQEEDDIMHQNPEDVMRDINAEVFGPNDTDPFNMRTHLFDGNDGADVWNNDDSDVWNNQSINVPSMSAQPHIYNPPLFPRQSGSNSHSNHHSRHSSHHSKPKQSHSKRKSGQSRKKRSLPSYPQQPQQQYYRGINIPETVADSAEEQIIANDNNNMQNFAPNNNKDSRKRSNHSSSATHSNHKKRRISNQNYNSQNRNNSSQNKSLFVANNMFGAVPQNFDSAFDIIDRSHKNNGNGHGQNINDTLALHDMQQSIQANDDKIDRRTKRMDRKLQQMNRVLNKHSIQTKENRGLIQQNRVKMDEMSSDFKKGLKQLNANFVTSFTGMNDNIKLLLQNQNNTGNVGNGPSVNAGEEEKNKLRPNGYSYVDILENQKNIDHYKDDATKQGSETYLCCAINTAALQHTLRGSKSRYIVMKDGNVKGNSKELYDQLKQSGNSIFHPIQRRDIASYFKDYPTLKKKWRNNWILKLPGVYDYKAYRMATVQFCDSFKLEDDLLLCGFMKEGYQVFSAAYHSNDGKSTMRLFSGPCTITNEHMAYSMFILRKYVGKKKRNNNA